MYRKTKDYFEATMTYLDYLIEEYDYTKQYINWVRSQLSLIVYPMVKYNGMFATSEKQYASQIKQDIEDTCAEGTKELIGQLNKLLVKSDNLYSKIRQEKNKTGNRSNILKNYKK